MWSTSFSDWAKKAQEATEAASSFAVGSTFNLDVMQSTLSETGDATTKRSNESKLPHPEVLYHHPQPVSTSMSMLTAQPDASSSTLTSQSPFSGYSTSLPTTTTPPTQHKTLASPTATSIVSAGIKPKVVPLSSSSGKLRVPAATATAATKGGTLITGTQSPSLAASLKTSAPAHKQQQQPQHSKTEATTISSSTSTTTTISPTKTQSSLDRMRPAVLPVEAETHPPATTAATNLTCIEREEPATSRLPKSTETLHSSTRKGEDGDENGDENGWGDPVEDIMTEDEDVNDVHDDVMVEPSNSKEHVVLLQQEKQHQQFTGDHSIEHVVPLQQEQHQQLPGISHSVKQVEDEPNRNRKEEKNAHLDQNEESCKTDSHLTWEDDNGLTTEQQCSKPNENGNDSSLSKLPQHPLLGDNQLGDNRHEQEEHDRRKDHRVSFSEHEEPTSSVTLDVTTSSRASTQGMAIAASSSSLMAAVDHHAAAGTSRNTIEKPVRDISVSHDPVSSIFVHQANEETTTFHESRSNDVGVPPVVTVHEEGLPTDDLMNSTRTSMVSAPDPVSALEKNGGKDALVQSAAANGNPDGTLVDGEESEPDSATAPQIVSLNREEEVSLSEGSDKARAVQQSTMTANPSTATTAASTSSTSTAFDLEAAMAGLAQWTTASSTAAVAAAAAARLPDMSMGSSNSSSQGNKKPMVNRIPGTSASKSLEVYAAVPDQILEQFSQQLARIEENHQAEIQDLEAQHQRALHEAGKAANHEACHAERKELDDRFKKQLAEKEHQFHELLHANERYKLKLDVLKREMDGTKELLDSQRNDIARTNESHLRDLRAFEKKVVEAENNASKAKDEQEKIRLGLEKAKEELSASQQEHADLKARVKVIATELKERRVECRELKSKIDDLNEVNDNLNEKVSNLEAQLVNQSRSKSEKNEEMDQLRNNLMDASKEIDRAKKALKDVEVGSEKAMADYKRKAQSSLAVANARSAAAVQAKEEAELEARAARSTADAAMDRAIKAELASKEAVAQSKILVIEKEREREAATEEAEESRRKLAVAELELARCQSELVEAQRYCQELSSELDRVRLEFIEQQKTINDLRGDLSDSKNQVKQLESDIISVRHQLSHAEAALAIAGDKSEEERKKQEAARQLAMSKASDSITIVALQQELRDANAAIEGLKEALKNAVQESREKRHVDLESDMRSSQNGDSGSGQQTPLLYAMEKQAELNTARAEINRLANVLSDVQSEKMAAVEEMEFMRKRLDETEAKLERFEKLHAASDEVTSNRTFDQNGTGSRVAPINSGAVNIEYLKNIVLSFLNAKSLPEKKALLPVIGAVLCLTGDELRSATKNLEPGSGFSFDSFLSHK